MKKQSVVTSIIIILVILSSVAFFRGCEINLSSDTITYDESGTFSDEAAYESGEINTPEVTIENATFSGTLTITDAVTEGTITLNNTVVADELIVNGAESVYLNGGTYKNITLNNENVKLVLLGDAKVTNLNGKSASSIVVTEESSITSLTIAKGAKRSTITTQNKGKIASLQIKSPADVILNTSANTVTFGAEASGSTFVNNAVIKKIQVETKMTLSINANVDTLIVTANGEGTVVTMNNNAVITNLGIEKPIEIKGSGAVTNATLPDESYLSGTITPQNISISGKPVVSDPSGGLMVTPTISLPTTDNTVSDLSVLPESDNWVSDSIINSDYESGSPTTEPDPTPISPSEPSTVAVTGVSLSPTEVTLTRGTSQVLTATVSPSDASNKAVAWSSSNRSVAVVDNGIVTPKGNGTATITVTTVDGSKTATCQVTVKTKITAVTSIKGITTSNNSISDLIAYGENYSLPATVLVKGYDDESFDCPVTFSPASVDSTKTGETTYIGTLNPPSGYVNTDDITAKIQITVGARPVITVSSTPTEEEIALGDTPSELSIKASVTEGKILTYTWYYKRSASADLILIPDATGSTYQPSSFDTAIPLQYYVKISADQAESVTTLAGTVTALSEVTDELPDSADELSEDPTVDNQSTSETPVIVTQPADQLLSETETTVTVEALVSKGTLTYQWYQSQVNSSQGGMAIDGATDATLIIDSQLLTDVTYYYVIITNTESGLLPSQSLSRVACITPTVLNLSIETMTPDALNRPALNR
ncbi:Ig-like domain-containing protein [Eubacteriaceae bacterium ES3]|nr:Ig-like domain-containing protein [Eubacteriaceae bacterium ES3]